MRHSSRCWACSRGSVSFWIAESARQRTYKKLVPIRVSSRLGTPATASSHGPPRERLATLRRTAGQANSSSALASTPLSTKSPHLNLTFLGLLARPSGAADSAASIDLFGPPAPPAALPLAPSLGGSGRVSSVPGTPKASISAVRSGSSIASAAGVGGALLPADDDDARSREIGRAHD